MPQWEYRKINLNDAGHDGWGLVKISANNFAYLKRQREDSAAAQGTATAARATLRKAPTTAG